jgi:rubrerythrin
MGDDKTLDILKNAILLEKRGKSFYSAVAEKTDKEAVKRFFRQMAAEEDSHIRILSEQFKSYAGTRRFQSSTFQSEHASGIAVEVITAELKDQISAADFEAAAIAAAMAMEKNAIVLYSQRAKESQDQHEQKLYDWLADWERSHLEFLAAIDREVTENIWHDNNFWPF